MAEIGKKRAREVFSVPA